MISFKECTRAPGTEAGQVGVQVGLELVEQHLHLGLAELSYFQLDGIDQLGAGSCIASRQDSTDLVHALGRSRKLAGDADARAAQAVRIQERV